MMAGKLPMAVKKHTKHVVMLAGDGDGESVNPT